MSVTRNPSRTAQHRRPLLVLQTNRHDSSRVFKSICENVLLGLKTRVKYGSAKDSISAATLADFAILLSLSLLPLLHPFGPNESRCGAFPEQGKANESRCGAFPEQGATFIAFIPGCLQGNGLWTLLEASLAFGSATV